MNAHCAICNDIIRGRAYTLCLPCAKSYDRQRLKDCTIDALLRWAGARARKTALTTKEK